MGTIFCLFQSHGASSDCHEFSNVMESDLATALANAFRGHWYTSLGPMDLCTFRFLGWSPSLICWHQFTSIAYWLAFSTKHTCYSLHPLPGSVPASSWRRMLTTRLDDWIRYQKCLWKTLRVWRFIAGWVSWYRSWHSCWTAVLSQIPGNSSVRRRLFFNILNTKTCLNLFTHINIFKTY